MHIPSQNPRGRYASLKIFLAVALLTSVATVAPGVPAFANDADFKLVNKTGYQIDEVYVSKHSSDDWGKDVMGRDALDDGELANIVFPHGNGACHFDIKLVYHDGSSSAEWQNVDLCAYETITLYWDAKKQVTRAVGE